jgi:hypothetical protein
MKYCVYITIMKLTRLFITELMEILYMVVNYGYC